MPSRDTGLKKWIKFLFMMFWVVIAGVLLYSILVLVMTTF